MEVQERRRGRPNRRWLDSVRDDIRVQEKGMSGKKNATQLHGGIHHHIPPWMSLEIIIAKRDNELHSVSRKIINRYPL